MTLTASEIQGLTHLGISSAIADLSQRIGSEVDTIKVLTAQKVTWPDASLGCPEPGFSYAQVLTPGILLVLSYQEKKFDYRITDFHGLLCEQAQQSQEIEGEKLEGIWSRVADLPTARSEVTAAELNGKIFVFGGFGSGATANEEYDPATDTWRQRAPIPLGVDHAAAVAVGGNIYLIGGFDGRWGPLNNVWAYDPETDAWTAKASLPTPRGALGAALVDGKIYAIGGRSRAIAS